MRHREPTTMALSPGIYMDASRVLNPCDISATSDIAGANAALNPPGVFVAATAAINTSFSHISPVLSMMHSSAVSYHSLPAQSPRYSNSPTVHHRHPLAVCQANELGAHHSIQIMDSKHRKRPKAKRRTLRASSGDGGRNWHSLKLTIRRTSKTHKVHPLVSTVTNTEPSISNRSLEAIPMCSSSNSKSDPSAPSDFSSGDVSSGRTIPSIQCVDACTSTAGCGMVTEPDPSSFCEPGTRVVVEGVVWLENTGMLVLNVQWRGRSYVGTLLDVTRSALGPSCPDKCITSALNLLTGRRSWARGSGRYRARGLRRFSHRRRSHHAAYSRCHDDRAAMTTRSAAAAAAAATSRTLALPLDGVIALGSTQSPDSSGDPRPSILPQQEREPRGPPVYDLDFKTSKSITSSTVLRGGRRRRRGAGSSRSYRRVSSKLRTCFDPPIIVDSSTLSSPSCNRPTTEVPDPPVTTVAFRCVFSECEREFSDLTTMRHHMFMEHNNSVQADCWSPRRPTPEVTQTDILTVPTETDSTPTSPPKLSRVHNGRCPDSDENSFTHTSSDDRFDDNRAPPRLHRIVSISDVSSHQASGSSPTTRHHRSLSPTDETSAPSPAYSDISDEGTVPAEQNVTQLRNTGNSSADSCGNLFPIGQPVISPFSCLVRRQTGLNLLGSSSLPPPGLAYSIPENQTGFYFPLNIVPAPTTSSSSTTVPKSIAGTLNAVRTSSDRQLDDCGIFKPSLQVYLSSTQTPYLVQTPSTSSTVIPISQVQASTALCIPGVNSFSFPSALTTASSSNGGSVPASFSNRISHSATGPRGPYTITDHNVRQRVFASQPTRLDSNSEAVARRSEYFGIRPGTSSIGRSTESI